MRVKKVTLDDLGSSYCCMNEVPPGVSWASTLPESKKWFKDNLGKHIEGYHILDGDRVVGHIYWETSEKALIPYKIEPKVAYIYCTEMLRNYLHKGHGRMMFDYMKDDLKKQGYKGILVDATNFKGFMYHELFEKQGFRVIKEHEPFKLMYFPLLTQKVEAEPMKLSYKPSADKVEITFFDNFFCPVGAYMYGLVKKVAQGFGDKVKIVEIKITPETIKKYGTSELLINGKIKIFGPASEKDVQKAIQEEVDQFKR